MPEVKWGTVGEWAGVVFGLVAIAVSVGSFAVQRDDLAAERARVDRIYEEQFAVYVDLGEVPIGDYGSDYLVSQLGERRDGEIWWAVYNANPVAIRDVWVEGPGEEFVWIDEIQRCTYYIVGASPSGRNLTFDPTSVHFRDPRSGWSRNSAGRIAEGYADRRDPRTRMTAWLTSGRWSPAGCEYMPSDGASAGTVDCDAPAKGLERSPAV